MSGPFSNCITVDADGSLRVTRPANFTDVQWQEVKADLDPIQPLLERVAKMPPEEQQALASYLEEL